MLNKYRDECHYTAKVKGFHDTKVPFPTLMMLLVTEIAEAVEADRNGDWEGVKEEMADVAIRFFDIAGAYNIDLDTEVEKKMKVNRGRPRKHNKIY